MKYNMRQSEASWGSVIDNLWQLEANWVNINENLWRFDVNWWVNVWQIITVIGSFVADAYSLWKLKVILGNQLLSISYF